MGGLSNPGKQGKSSPFLKESESESALFTKCAQTHEEFVVVFEKLLVHTTPNQKKLGQYGKRK